MNVRKLNDIRKSVASALARCSENAQPMQSFMPIQGGWSAVDSILATGTNFQPFIAHLTKGKQE
jgi:hypothetical protein